MLARRTLLAALFCTQAHAAIQPTPNDTADIARIEAYLNGMKSLKARFLQVAPDGGIARGTAWLVRPGRMRFEYDPPSPFLLVAGPRGLIFHDSQLKQTSQIPQSRTPLGILLADRVVLSGDASVLAIERLPGQIHIVIARTAAPGDGALTLTFADNPLALRQWTVTDAQRKETRVSLSGIELGGQYDPMLFEFHEDAVVPGSSGG